MKIFCIHLYSGDSRNVIAVVSDEAGEMKLLDATAEFAKLGHILANRNDNNPQYTKALEIIEGGFVTFLNSKGIVTPQVTHMSLWADRYDAPPQLR